MANNRFRGRRVKTIRDNFSALSSWFRWVPTASRSFLRFGLLVTVLGGLGYGTYTAVLKSPHFTIRHVKIETIPQLSQDEILKTVGLDRPVNIFKFNPDDARRRLKMHPWVSRVDVAQHLPDRVDIKLSERRPTGVVALGEFFLVDGEGTPFVRADLKQVDQFPVVTGLSRNDFLRNPDQFRIRVQNALSVVRRYKRYGLKAGFPSVGEVYIGTANRISLMAGRTRIGLGSSGFDEKLSRLERVFATLKRRKVGADYILFGDVPSRVVVKERLRNSKKTKTVTLNVSGA